MQLFEMTHKVMAMIGIRLYWPEVQNRFNCRSLGILTLFFLFSTSSTAFIIFDANSFREYEDACFAWISVTFTFVGLLINVLKAVDILRLIENFETICEICKCFKFQNKTTNNMNDT